MDVTFVADNPREKARSHLDNILGKGVDQIVIACAFCTAAGVQLLQKHVARLKLPDSFVVVAADVPTDYKALGDLHARIKGNLFVHWGAASPVEIKLGAALMHSKVFYARSGRECWLWTGSHNLTANATQGANSEAAVLLHGDVEEQPFIDAMHHLLSCRAEAAVYDPETPPNIKSTRADLVVIHAETDAVPSDPLPWHAQLCLETADLDDLLNPPAKVELLLYPRGSLFNGWTNAAPIAAYSGSLTGQNLTARNPNASRAGTEAEWSAAQFGIAETGGVLVFGPDAPPSRFVTTQAVIYLSAVSDQEQILFAEEPRVEARRIAGNPSLMSVDPDMRRFYKRKSLRDSGLIHAPYTGREFVMELVGMDTRERDMPRIANRLSADREFRLALRQLGDNERPRRHPFIVRAKYRA